MASRKRRAGFLKDRAGATAVEFALVLPAFVSLIVGGLCAGQLAFAVSGLQFAVQEGARCAAVKTTVCTSGASTISYAAAQYQGPAIAPSFTYAASGCGHTVSATGSYVFMIPVTVSLPLTATACFP